MITRHLSDTKHRLYQLPSPSSQASVQLFDLLLNIARSYHGAVNGTVSTQLLQKKSACVSRLSEEICSTVPFFIPLDLDPTHAALSFTNSLDEPDAAFYDDSFPPPNAIPLARVRERIQQ